MSGRLQKLAAKFALAILFFIHLFKRLFIFWRKSSGLSRFFEHYAADGVLKVSDRERQIFPALQRCQNCSLCTYSCTAILEGKSPSGFEPKYIMLGLGRSSHESEIFLEEWLPCMDCGACEVLCPNDVPIHAMIEVIIERRNQTAFR